MMVVVMTTMTLCVCVCDRYKKRFHKFDKERKGFITTVDVQQVLEVSDHLSVGGCVCTRLRFLSVSF